VGREHQRLFHLGRELKSGRRSLSALGFGKHENFIVHLHSTAPTTIDLAEDEEVKVQEVKPDSFARGCKRATEQHLRNIAHSEHSVAINDNVIELLEDGDDDQEVSIVDDPAAKFSAKRIRR